MAHGILNEQKVERERHYNIGPDVAECKHQRHREEGDIYLSLRLERRARGRRDGQNTRT